MELCHLVIDEDTQGKEARNIYTQISMIVDTWTSTTMEAYMNDRLLIERHAQALSLIKRADTALLAAKQNGKNNFALAI